MKLYLALGLVLLSVGLGAQARASESQFGFVYTTDLLPKGAQEVEQWVTWRTQKNGGTYNLLEGKTAYEYGVADNFQIALYLKYAWNQASENGPYGTTTPGEAFVYDHPAETEDYSATRFIGVSVEEIFRLLSPYTDPVGLALYLEPTVGPDFVELETRLILQKNFLDDTLIFGFNGTWAPEFRYVSPEPGSGETQSAWDEEVDINLAFAGSYRFRENWSAGFEFINERELRGLGFSHEANSGYFFGPSLHYGGQKFFVTGVLLRQLPFATIRGPDTVAGSVVNGLVVDNDFELYRFRVKVGFYF